MASVRPVVVVGLVGLVGVAGFAGGITAARMHSSGPMRVTGSLTLLDAQTERNLYVVILRDGGVVGATRLGAAVADRARGSCTWRWTVPAVPRGEGTYSVVISDRGWNAFTSSQLARGEAALTLRRFQ